MNDWERMHRQAQIYKDAYPPGTRVMLLHMNDPYSPVEEGMRGTVKVVDDAGQLHMQWDTICMTRSNKNAITDFKKSKNGILFASGSMWEGVDCVGDCLSSVIIVRLPFPMRSALMKEKKDSCSNVADFVDRYCTPPTCSSSSVKVSVV